MRQWIQFVQHLKVVEAIREKVTLVPEIKSSKSDAQQVEILEKVGFCIAVNPPIVKVWLKVRFIRFVGYY